MTWSNVINVSEKPPDLRRELAMKSLKEKIFAMKPQRIRPVKRRAESSGPQLR